MLVLSRKKDEVIVIQDVIRVMVIEIRGDKVRLGIDAPRSMTVHREEVWLDVQKEKAQCNRLTSIHGSDGGSHQPPESS